MSVTQGGKSHLQVGCSRLQNRVKLPEDLLGSQSWSPYLLVSSNYIQDS